MTKRKFIDLKRHYKPCPSCDFEMGLSTKVKLPPEEDTFSWSAEQLWKCKGCGHTEPMNSNWGHVPRYITLFYMEIEIE